MAGIPGSGVNNPEGFFDIITPPTPRTIVVDAAAGGDIPIPLAVFPFWLNDSGVRTYGGAKRISIFDAGASEGVSTADIPHITDQPIENQGTFSISNPDPQKLYKIIIRLRSASGDPNFRDFPASFRITTPLEIPLEFTTWSDGDTPDITYNGVDFVFNTDAGAAEVRLRDAQGGIPLPSAGGEIWHAAAKDFMLKRLLNDRDGVIVIDFYAAAGVSESTRRQFYHFYFDGADWQFEKIRSRNYPEFDRYSGSELGIAQANIDRLGLTATIDFINNGNTYGQKIETLVVTGRQGQKNIDPKLVVAGGQVDIADVIDFTDVSFLSKFDVDDQFVILTGITEEKVVIRHIPLWVQATELVQVDSDSLVPSTTSPIPADILQARLVHWPYITFPNMPTFYNPPPTLPVGADPAGGIYPDLLNIQLFDGLNPVAVATYTDEVDLWNNLVELQLPNQGLTIPVLDVRALLTSTSPFFRITADVRTVGSAPGIAYSYSADFPLNVNGEPVLWDRDDVTLPTILPTFKFDEWGKLEITWPAGIVAFPSGDFTIEGDAGTQTETAPAGPFPQVVVYDIHESASRYASYVDVVFTANDGGPDVTYRFRVPTTVQNQQLIGVTDITPIFTGNLIVFPTGSLANVQVEVGGNQIITVIGDIGQITIFDAQENVPYMLGQFGDGGERPLSNPLHTFVDIDFTDTGAVATRVRVGNSFWDLREGKGRAFAVASRGHGPTAGGTPSLSHDFTLPRAKITLGTSEIEFEDDLSGLLFNFSQWAVWSGHTIRKRIFNGTIVVATPYVIGDVLVGSVLNDHVIVTAKHQNGHQKTWAIPITGNFESPKRLQIEGFF